METLYSLLLGCVVIVLLIGGSVADSWELDSKKGAASANGEDISAGGSKVPVSHGDKSDMVDKVKKIKNGDMSESANQFVGSGSIGESKGNARDGKKDEKKSSSSAGTTGDFHVSENGSNAGTMTPLRKNGPRVEDCDPSNRCVAEKGKLVGCLRFPGNDSPKLSLLIQNKGKGSLTVSISAPDLVELKETKIQVKEKESREVMISVRKSGSQSSINLTAGTDICSLNLEMILGGPKDFEGLTTSKTMYYLRQKSTTAYIVLVALFVLATVGIFTVVSKKVLLSRKSKYQRLDMMELPVSNVKKPKLSDVNEGWDDSWGDGWDDEELPETPSKPVTTNLSSTSLIPKRATKEGWND
ncbi:hypothetical protein SAY87_014508 [Trapa incisa]|uniref:DUF7356 domain-containing protein n=1 Tax=Trapa incisa TaxID=236973 RepID=A0AAN7JKI5_9MYRT|nr:hypothetical protein SAY87_014508 [Trapa incisa]